MSKKRPLQAPPVDPNQGQNRVPLQAELLTLRNIRADKLQMAQSTRRQYEAARETHERIQARYDMILQEMESIQSELNVSHDYLTNLEKQLKTLQKEDKRLAGLLHPIRRCPDDVLVLIFECFYELEGPAKLKVATNISHVCKRWRNIALKTSSLWTEIDISMDDDLKSILLFTERTSMRLRTTPVNIRIRDIHDWSFEDTENFIHNIGLSQFRKIKVLHYSLDTSKELELLSNPAFGGSRTRVEHLIISAASISEEETESWDCNAILKRLKDLQILQLENLDDVDLKGEDSFPSLHTINFKNVHMPTLASQFSRFAGLESIQISGSGYEMNPLEQDLILPKLRELEVVEILDFPWRQITAPRLWTLNTDDPTHDCSAFIVRHATIHDLIHHVFLQASDLDNIAAALPHLEVLSTAGSIQALFKKTNGNTLLPNLKELQFVTIATHGLSLQDFEDLTRLRGMTRKGEAQVDGVERLEIFSIVVDIEKVHSQPWRKSPLQAHWQETVTNQNLDLGVCIIELRPIE